MKNKVLSLFITFILLISLIPSDIVFAAENDEYTDGIFTYTELADGTLSVTGYSGSGGLVTIPSEYDPGTGTMMVTTVGDSVFTDSSTLTGITIPHGITAIGASAFKNCSMLGEITIPDSVISLGDSAFESCVNLSSVTLGTGLISVGASTFKNCSMLGEITIPNFVTTLGESAFEDCKSLSSVTLGTGLSTTGALAFEGCTSLTAIVIPEGITSIDDWAFANCEKLSNITLPDSLRRIGENAFYYCGSLASIRLPDGLETIGYAAFESTPLTTVLIPDSVITIAGGTFNGCRLLTYVKLPKDLTSIGQYMFFNCNRLTSITLPANVTHIDYCAFYGCWSLENITIPDGVTEIGSWVFRDCILTDITLPDSVITLGNDAFSGCSTLEKLTILNKSLSLLGCFVDTNLTADGIYGFSGSAAQTYANSFGIPFHYLYTVTFDTVGGSIIDDEIIVNGEQLVQPPDPTKSVWEFVGWFKDEAYTQPVSFPYTITADATLYAKWYLAVDSVTLDEETLNMVHHDTQTLTATVLPVDASYPEVTWTSSDESVAAVNSAGVVEAVGVGEATITATADGVSDTCAVTVAKKPVTSVTLSDETLSMVHHDTQVLTATVLPVDATYPEVTWTSSNESVATVDINGVVTAVGLGFATITAMADGISDTCDITVNKNPVTSVMLSQETLSMVHHDKATLTAEVLPSNATYTNVTWISSNDTVATVDQNGNIEAVGVGDAIITATADGISDTCEVTVTKKPVTSVTLDKETLSIIHHDTQTLTATVLPSNATYPEVTWTSDNESVATGDSNGVVTAVSLGSATITATADGISDTCAVTVTKKPVTSVTLNENTLDMIHHDMVTLSAEVLPSNATYTDITWTSSNESIATVSSAGVVEAVGVGNAIITATADGISDTCQVTVAKKPVTSVTLSKDTLEMIHHDVTTLTATVLPVDATYTDVTWTSSDSSVATVDSSGIVVAAGVGSTVITATADGIADVCTVTVNKKPVDSVTLSEETMTMLHHDTAVLTTEVLPFNASYPEVTWETSNSSVVTVDQDGNIEAVGLGNVVITATADGVSDTCAITVNKRPVTSVTLSEETLTMEHHDKVRLTAEVLPSNATYPEVTWETSNSAVVTVDQNGNIEAVGLGNAVITATADGISDTCNITVNKKPVDSVTLSQETLIMEHHDKQKLTAEVLPGNATYPDVVWESSDDTIVSVDQNGNIEAISLGNVTITATADGVSEICEVTVNKKPVASVTLNSTDEKVFVGDVVTLAADVLPINATYPEVIWVSSDETLATVDENGVVTTIKGGRVTITATADGMSADCNIFIIQPVTSVTLSSKSKIMIHHDTLTLTSEVLPDDATYPEVTWKTSNRNVASVNQSGKVTAVGVGSATITSTADDISDICVITVNKKPVTDVALSENELSLVHHDTVTLTAKVIPSNATYQEITWVSSDPSVVTIDESGRVSAVGVGSAEITATADDVTAACNVTVEKKPVTSVSLNKTALTLIPGGTFELTASVEPSNATYPQIIWESSDPSVAEVDDTGVVKAISTGSAVVTVEADGIAATCEVTVQPESDKTVTITGVLTDDKGKPLAGKVVELHSDPMSTVTDKDGRFTFEDVCVEHHTLIIMDTAGDPIKEFAIDLNTEDDFKWEEDEDACVNIMLSKDTAAVELSISLNNKDFGITDVQDVTYPIKTSGSIWTYIVIGLGVLLAVLVGIYAVLKIKRRSTS